MVELFIWNFNWYLWNSTRNISELSRTWSWQKSVPSLILLLHDLPQVRLGNKVPLILHFIRVDFVAGIVNWPLVPLIGPQVVYHKMTVTNCTNSMDQWATRFWHYIWYVKMSWSTFYWVGGRNDYILTGNWDNWKSTIYFYSRENQHAAVRYRYKTFSVSKTLTLWQDFVCRKCMVLPAHS